MLAQLLAVIGIKEIALFVSSVIIFTLTPGIDTLFVLNRATCHGKRLGVMSALGVATGVLVHTAFASFGLAGIVAKSATLFMMIKYLGASYLVYLGLMSVYHAIKNPSALILKSAAPQTPLTHWQAYRSGLLTNVLNPKVALFFLAFFPQFITPAMTDNAMPYLVLGTFYALVSALWLVALALLAGSVLSGALTSQRAKKYMDIGSGVVFVGMGAKVAFFE